MEQTLLNLPTSKLLTNWNPNQRRLLIFLWISLAGWALFGVHYLLNGHLVTGALDTATSLCFLSLLIAGRIRDRLELDFNLGMFANLGTLTLASFISGQSASMDPWFFCLVPVAVLCQKGSQATLRWTALSLVLVLSIHLSQRFVEIQPEVVHQGWELALGQIAIILLMLSFSLMQWRVIEVQVKLSDERARASSAQAVALGRARDQAIAAAEARSRFLATMSHEIRTPLNGILGTASALEHAGLSSEQKDLIGIIRSSGDLLLGLVNDILDFSKLESGKLKFESVSFCLAETTAGVIKGLGREAEERALKLEFKVEGEHTRRVGDPLRIRQVLVNLISNAIKFTHRGGVTVTLRAHADELSVEVQDTGIGMDADQLESVFQPFQQGDTSTTRRYGGTGLGLAICKKLTADMNGTLTVKSQPDRGSTFTFRARLPLATGTSNFSLTRVQQKKIPDLTGLTVLVVDDNPINLRVAMTLLRKLRCKTTSANNGLEALQLAEKQNFGVVLMDAHMPEMDGAESTRRIRGLSLAKRPVIIAVTADVMPEQARLLYEAGVDDVLYKPFTLEVLQNNLIKWLPEYEPEHEGAEAIGAS